jgi:Cullin family
MGDQPFRAHTPMDRTVATQTWEALANAIDEIYNRNASQLSFEELYRNAYNLVLHKHGTLLYEGVSEKLSSHLLETVGRLAEAPDSSLLEEVATTWSEHQVCLNCRMNTLHITIFIPLSSRPDYNDHGSRHSYVHGPHIHSATTSSASV